MPAHVHTARMVMLAAVWRGGRLIDVVVRGMRQWRRKAAGCCCWLVLWNPHRRRGRLVGQLPLQSAGRARAWRQSQQRTGGGVAKADRIVARTRRAPVAKTHAPARGCERCTGDAGGACAQPELARQRRAKEHKARPEDARLAQCVARRRLQLRPRGKQRRAQAAIIVPARTRGGFSATSFARKHARRREAKWALPPPLLGAPEAPRRVAALRPRRTLSPRLGRGEASGRAAVFVSAVVGATVEGRARYGVVPPAHLAAGVRSAPATRPRHTQRAQRSATRCGARRGHQPQGEQPSPAAILRATLHS